jgi:hypothetical protein
MIANYYKPGPATRDDVKRRIAEPGDDGMPDDWERKHGLNPKNADDRNTLASDSYTVLEKYINSIK